MIDVLARSLGELKIDTRCQAREYMDEQALEEYADAYRSGEMLPPLDVFEVDGELVVVDGFHRVEAARRAEVLTLAVRIVGQGSMADAEWHALASNQKHGLRRTREDKRRAVRRALELDPSRSNREIARHVGVSDPFVGKIRRNEVFSPSHAWLSTLAADIEEYVELLDQTNEAMQRRDDDAGLEFRAAASSLKRKIDPRTDALFKSDPAGSSVETVKLIIRMRDAWERALGALAELVVRQDRRIGELLAALPSPIRKTYLRVWGLQKTDPPAANRLLDEMGHAIDKRIAELKAAQ